MFLLLVCFIKSIKNVKIVNASDHIDISFTIYDAILTNSLNLCKIISDEGVTGGDKTKSG